MTNRPPEGTNVAISTESYHTIEFESLGLGDVVGPGDIAPLVAALRDALDSVDEIDCYGIITYKTALVISADVDDEDDRRRCANNEVSVLEATADSVVARYRASLAQE